MCGQRFSPSRTPIATANPRRQRPIMTSFNWHACGERLVQQTCVCFYLFTETTQPPMSQNEPQVMAYEPREQNSSRILIVEDNADLRRVLSEILQFEGFTIQSVSSGEDALRWLTSAPELPVCIMTDLMLEGMDGCALLGEIRTHPRMQHIPVIFLSGQTQMRDACGPDGPRPDGFVEKPFTIIDLVQLIRETIQTGPRA